MKSPFPGMDPYLERHWPDVHTALIAGARETLNARLPGDLLASTEERIAIETDQYERHIAPDVRIIELPPDAPAEAEPDAAATAVAAPFRLIAQVEPITERFIRIIDAQTERMITVIEFLSPANKKRDGLYAFRAKRGELLASGVNFVEIDLVRSGDWRALLLPFRVTARTTSTYRALIRLAEDPGSAYIYPIRLQDPLPDLPIPLRPHDPEVKLPLQSLLDSAYAGGRYPKRLDYRQNPDPPLEPDEARWADELLKQAARR